MGTETPLEPLKRWNKTRNGLRITELSSKKHFLYLHISQLGMGGKERGIPLCVREAC